ncbi:hypothetical protein BHE74_00051631 [Ensete ventricosum]|nr:hypothetical protein BHE74_00051631 [Ensete ventricosum]
MEREEPLSSRLVVATTVVGAVAAGVGVQVLLPSTRQYYCCSNRSRCAGTTALYGVILLCGAPARGERERERRKRDHGSTALELERRITSLSPPPFRLVCLLHPPKNTHTHHLSVSLFIHSFIVEECITPLSVPRFSTFQSTRAIEREEPSSSRLVVATAVLLLFIEPPVSPLSDEGSFPPPLPPCLNPTFHNRDSARAMEREEPSSSPLMVVATVLLLLITPPVSPLVDEGPFPPLPPVPPPCLNPTFHDRDSAIVACANSLKLLEPLMRSKAAKQDEQKVEYSPRAEEAQSGAPTGKRSHKEKLITAETRLDVLEASLEELYQAKEGSLG